jgi:hypothetical protein
MIRLLDPNIRTFAVTPDVRMFGCSDVRRQKSGERILELRPAVTASRQVRAFVRVEDDRADIIRLQKRGEFALADRGSAAERAPL